MFGFVLEAHSPSAWTRDWDNRLLSLVAWQMSHASSRPPVSVFVLASVLPVSRLVPRPCHVLILILCVIPDLIMNAVSLYVTASRLIFSSLNLDDSGKWSDINRLIVFLRQSLTCCVCGNLLVVPMTSAVSSCQHHVCKGCMGGKMRLKPSCSFCKDQSKFTENVQLRVLLQ